MIVWSVLAALIATPVGGERPESIAFHYGASAPLEALSVHDWVVVDPVAIETASTARRLAPAVPLAYVGVGETAGGAPWSAEVDEAWVLGRNPDWGGRVMDVAAPGWSDFLVDRALPALWARGFRGFFLDALDAHVAVVRDEEGRRRRWEALAKLVQRIRARFPDAVLLANRGFEILDTIAPAVNGVAAESLFAGWDPRAKRYRDVSADDRRWLDEKLQAARRLGLVTVAIDYLPASARGRAREVAGRIARLGHRPWVAPAELDAPGVGGVEVLPRRVLLVWDSKAEGRLEYSAVHRFLALPLEHLGLVPEYVDVRGPLPERRLAGEVAGVVTWLGGQPIGEPDRLRAFMLRQVREGVPLVVFGVLGEEANPALLDALGLIRGAPQPADDLKVRVRSPLIGFEASSGPAVYEVDPIQSDGRPGFEPLLELGFGEATTQPILLAPWGGLALQPYFMAESFEAEGRWVVDPFEFLRRALRIPVAPVVDPTTENGRRLLIAHVDGDGAASRAELPGRPLAITAARRRLFERYRFAHTVSVVEGEISKQGLHPELAERLQAEARRVFRLPHVTPASHGFAHPFRWRAFESGAPEHLPLSSGTPSLAREIGGSLDYVAQLSGRPVDLFLWTGDALPGPLAMEAVEAAGAKSLNGGFTVISDAKPSVTHISPLGRPVGRRRGQPADRARGRYFQVYAPILNENVFTNRWTGPFWGYRRVRQTFQRTGHPRRLTPLGIYYHLFSATKQASLRALHQVYADALAREPLPIPAGIWVDKALEQRRAVVARTLDGRFIVVGAEQIRTLRVDERLGAVDVRRSIGVLGARSTKVGRYVHLDGRRRVTLALEPPELDSGPRLIEASARVTRAERTKAGLTLEFEGPAPVSVTVAGGRCGPGRGTSTAEGRRFLLRSGLTLTCRGEAGR